MIQFMNNSVPAEGELFVYLDEKGIADLLAIIEMARRSGDEHLFDEKLELGHYGLTVQNPTHSYKAVTVVIEPATE